MPTKAHPIAAFTFALLVTAGCKEPFEARSEFVDQSYLVVDGYIDVANNATTKITVSRTTPINEKTYFLPEQGALIYIEDQADNSYPLSEQDSGVYISEALSLNQNTPYRIKIILNSGMIVYSEFAEPVITPEIDSVTWTEFPDGIQIYVSSHKQENSTPYYQWRCNEVWERVSEYYSYVRFKDGKFSPRPHAERESMKTCWVYNASSNIHTINFDLYQDGIVPSKEILFIPRYHESLFVRYSLTVSQVALTRKGFEFYEVLKKNGSLGGFFDPMPSGLSGNLYIENGSKPVIGFIGVSNTQTKRLEILTAEVTNWVFPPNCFVPDQPSTIEGYIVLQNAFLPTRTAVIVNETITAVDVALKTCVDCRLANKTTLNGTNIKPSFWN